VRTKLVKGIEVNNGVIRIVIDLPADHQFAANIREDVADKLGHLWDVKEVQVEFAE
jgi:citrate lyase gamma subunit